MLRKIGAFLIFLLMAAQVLPAVYANNPTSIYEVDFSSGVLPTWITEDNDNPVTPNPAFFIENGRLVFDNTRETTPHTTGKYRLNIEPPIGSISVAAGDYMSMVFDVKSETKIGRFSVGGTTDRKSVV